VLKLVAEGRSNKFIAEYLCLSVKTVEKHRSNLMRKLDLHNASMLTSFAIGKGLLAGESGPALAQCAIEASRRRARSDSRRRCSAPSRATPGRLSRPNLPVPAKPDRRLPFGNIFRSQEPGKSWPGGDFRRAIADGLVVWPMPFELSTC